MTSTIELKSINETSLGSFLPLHSSVISLLANSNTCGLAMLVDKLLSKEKNNITMRQLINSLINRFHYNSISILASDNDDPENFIETMLERAITYSQNTGPSSLESASRLLAKSLYEFEQDLSDSHELEHHWKEFIFHFYRSRLLQ